jgi:peptide-methionine (S)-S-oxide reductase
VYIFWHVHDPTQLNRQGPDVGPQYRSIILYQTEEERQIAEQSRENIASEFSEPIATEIKPLDQFYEAEHYHQEFYSKNPNQGYCRAIIDPKIQKLYKKPALQDYTQEEGAQTQ